MKLRKIAVAAVSLFVLFSTAIATAETDAHKTFDLLKGMEGKWAGKNTQGEPLQVTFRSTAGGSALVSEIHASGKDDMITMFHMDGDRLLMTHYCSAGNQPRMKAVTSNGKSVSFEFVDGTNIGPEDGHMQRVTFAKSDANHHTEDWVYVAHGKEVKELFTLERAK
jgi:hypothetical protein